MLRYIGGLEILYVEGRSEQLVLAALAASTIYGPCLIRVGVMVRLGLGLGLGFGLGIGLGLGLGEWCGHHNLRPMPH